MDQYCVPLLPKHNGSNEDKNQATDESESKFHADPAERKSSRLRLIQDQFASIQRANAKTNCIQETYEELALGDLAPIMQCFNDPVYSKWVPRYIDLNELHERKIFPPYQAFLEIAKKTAYPGFTREHISWMLKYFFNKPDCMLFTEFLDLVEAGRGAIDFTHVQEMTLLGGTDEMFAELNRRYYIPGSVKYHKDRMVIDLIEDLIQRNVIEISIR